MIDIDALKRDWRRKAALHGVNVLEGVTVYTEANMKAQAAKEGHYERMAALVREHAERHPLNYDNGYGEADTYKVKRQARRDWWVYAFYWKQGPNYHPARHTEQLAFFNLGTEVMQLLFPYDTPMPKIRLVEKRREYSRGNRWRDGQLSRKA